MKRATVRQVVAALAALLTATTIAVSVPASAASPAGCPGRSQYATDPGEFAPSRHPLVLVHGWSGTSDSMGEVERGLQSRMPGVFDFRYFDYRQNRTDWAARPAVAACLAEYVNEVHDNHVASGGDGRVYVVAHSMGGLAMRFATSADFVPEPVQPSSLGGIVLLGTPHRGSVFGDTLMAEVAEWALEQTGEPLVPDRSSDAAHCLALHGPDRDLPDDCATPPYLPPDVSLASVAGSAVVSRTIFGIHLYDIPLVSDGVVGVDSSHGYLTSGPGDEDPPRVDLFLPTDSCTVTSDVTMSILWDAVRAKSGSSQSRV